MKTHFIVFMSLLSLTLVSCNSSDEPTRIEQETLDGLKQEIIELAESSICTENIECRFIAFGSKPCGGPFEYLVYSTSINTDLLEARVKEYNDLENALNIKEGRISDCSFVTPPIELVCDNGKCTAIYN